ncbi:MAG: methylated-DNA--[protein]-cysteine S-methyltransferase [Deltaproteobacteria bacterium]|nr:methylated-DNA--[protein]-cysteine S-methyltransferase [Deltaproteobacteria bacterium]
MAECSSFFGEKVRVSLIDFRKGPEPSLWFYAIAWSRQGISAVMPVPYGLEESELQGGLGQFLEPLPAELRLLERYALGERVDLRKLPILWPRASSFALRVWKSVHGTLGHGETVSYGELAKSLFGSSKRARALGQALSKNPLLIVVPCHRVIGGRGNLGGYQGGPSRKASLLRLEGIRMEKLECSD